MTNKKSDLTGVEMFGAILMSFAQACINLNILAAEDQAADFKGFEPMQWYPAERYARMIAFINQKYTDPAPIKEKVGIEMMRLWYEFGPGKQIVKKGVDFLHFQASSQGFHSVVRGDPSRVGTFTLEKIDEASGKAIVAAKNPFDPDQQRGVIIGGLGLPGDLNFIDVDNSKDPNVYLIEFH